MRRRPAAARQAFYCHRVRWRGRDAYALGNHVVRLTALTGGGHIAAFQLEQADGHRSISPLWSPPWKTIEPHAYAEQTHKRHFGTLTEGKLLSGIAGHNICLDYFGLPSPDEVEQGLSLHGEAPSIRWRKTRTSRDSRALGFGMATRLPAAGLQFHRQIELRQDEPIVYFTETVRNERSADHFFQWAQHVTLGPQFLAPQVSSIAVAGSRAMTSPDGYDEGRALLASDREFRWPEAPLAAGGTTDLTQPFVEPGFGFVVTVLVDKARPLGFVAAVNRKQGVVVAYLFRRCDFPWVAVWEENLAIAAPPWRQRTRARALEFSTTPLPLARRTTFLSRGLFDEPTLACVPALGARTVTYLALLTRVPAHFGDVRDITVDANGIHITGDGAVVSVAAPAAAERLA